jgi:Mn-dependent DtxR family transcriptional regulator
MKKYVEILEEIKTARAAITDTAKTEKELERAAYMETARNGSPAEKEKARAAFKAVCDRLREEETRNNDIKIKIEILKENAKQALFSEIIETICEIWNKYENKPHGEKTAQKIRDEIKSATGERVYIGNKWGDANITIYPTETAYSEQITIAPIWNGEKQPALNNNNKIIKLSAENLRVCYCGAYVDDVNAHLTALKEAHAGALAALETYRAAIDKYNSLTRGNMQRASDREGVKHYII